MMARQVILSTRARVMMIAHPAGEDLDRQSAPLVSLPPTDDAIAAEYQLGQWTTSPFCRQRAAISTRPNQGMSVAPNVIAKRQPEAASSHWVEPRQAVSGE